MNNNYQLEKITPSDYSSEDWQQYFTLRTEWSKSRKNAYPYKSWEELKERSINRYKNGQAVYIVKNNGLAIGDFSFDINIEDKPEKRFTYFRNGLPQSKINSEFLNVLIQAAKEFDPLSKFLAVHSSNGENDFIEKEFQGFAAGNSESFELNIKDAIHEKINQWLESSPKKSPQFRIEFLEDVPDNLMEEYIHSFKELLKDMPPNSELADHELTVEGEKEMQEQARKENRTSYKYFIFNENNELIAHTNVAIHKNKPQIMYQYMTGVLRGYRGRGLSKWLKAAMFQKLIEDFPDLEKINTSTHPENHASRELSKQMGFVKTGSYKEFLISIR